MDNIFLNVSHNLAGFQKAWKSVGSIVSKSSQKFNGANKNLNRMQGGLRNLNADANRSITRFGNLGKAVGNLNAVANRSITRFGNLGKAVGNINFAAKTVEIIAMARGLARVVQSSMDSIEVTNMFNVAMGDLAVETNKTLAELSEITGLDLTNLRQAVGTFNNLARSMGLANDIAQKISLNATKMAFDLSSLFNIPFEQVLADIKSGLLGQTETVYKYGQDLTEAGLKEEALALGIQESVRNMTQGEKMFLRMSKAMRQSSLAAGDFANTINQPANQLRLLGENVTTLGRSFGNLFIPILQKIVPYIRGVVMAITALFDLIASFLGFETKKIENTSSGFGTIEEETESAGAGVDKLKKKLDDLSAPFDELNAINIDDSTGSSGGGAGGGGLGGIDPEILAALEEYDSMMGNIRQKANEIRDAILAWLGLTRELNEVTGEYEVKIVEGGFVDQFKTEIEQGDWASAGTVLAVKINSLIDPSKFTNIGEQIGKWLSDALLFVNTFLDTLDFEGIGVSISNLINGTLETINGYQLGKFLAQKFQIAIRFLGTLVGNLDFDLVKTKLQSAITGFFENINFTDAGKLVANIYKLLSDVIEVVFSKESMELLAKKIEDFFRGAFSGSTGISPEELAEPFVNIINGIIEFLKTTLTSDNVLSLVMYIYDAISALVNGIDWISLMYTVFEILLGLALSLIQMLATSLEKNIVDPIAFVFGLIIDLFKNIWTSLVEWFKASGLVEFWNTIKEYFTIEKWKELGNEMKEGIVAKWNEFKDWWKNTGIYKWWTDDVAPWFTIEKWKELANSIKDGIVAKWNDFMSWWKTTGIYTWWENDVKPWFTLDKWKELATNIKDGIVKKWNDFVDWWNDLGIVKWWDEYVAPWFTKEKWIDLGKGLINGFKDTWKKAVNGAIDLLNKFIGWVNEKLHFDFDGLTVAGVEIIPSFSFQLFELPKIPKLARGGIIEAGTIFQAGEAGAELIGSYNNNTTVMPLENSGFIESMYRAVYTAVSSAQQSGGQVIENVLTVDGEVLYKSQKKVEARKGVSFGTTAFAR